MKVIKHIQYAAENSPTTPTTDDLYSTQHEY